MYKTLSARLGAFFLTALCAVCAQAQSIEVVDQLSTPDMYSIDGAISDTRCQVGPPPTPRSASAADDFRVQPPPGETGLRIFAVQFIGSYSPAGREPQNPTPFVLRIRDDAGGQPGAVREVLTPVPDTVVSTQLVSGIFQFSLNVERVTLEAGLYWLEVAENDTSTDTDCWTWLPGPLDVANGRDGSAWDNDFEGPLGWTPVTGESSNMAMRILADAGSEVPTAVPMLAREGMLLLGGLLMLAVFWQRRAIKS